jgi:cytochrome c peroxidase
MAGWKWVWTGLGGVVALVAVSAAGIIGADRVARAPAPMEDPAARATAVRRMALEKTNPLDTVPVQDAPNFKKYIVNRAALRVLGKALFWDEQVGSDRQACASCHFHAGADNRSKNQLNPGFRSERVPGGELAFSPPFGPNYQLVAGDFPFHKLADPRDRGSTVVSDTNDVASSQGSFNRTFVANGLPVDVGTISVDGPGAVFQVNGQPVRSSAPRNTPTSIGAVLNHRNFWDGRARRESNGVNPLGELDPTVRLVRAVPATKARPSNAVLVQIRISNSSGSSQASGPPESDLEMAFAGRTFPLLGRKLLAASVVPLGQQLVATDDTLLGPFSRQAGAPGARGVDLRYADLVRQSFDPTWWDAPGWYVDLAGSSPTLVKGTMNQPATQFTVMEFNFALFFGIAVQEYEKLLIPSQSRFDHFLAGDLSALSAQEVDGLEVFLDKGRCINCHAGAELTNASLAQVENELVERMVMGDGRVAVYDAGFYNIGVRPTLEDLGVGGRIGPKNLPLSNTRFFQEKLAPLVAKLVSTGTGIEEAVRQANETLKVPRVRARPDEALVLLRRAAALLADPDPVLAYFVQAEARLAAQDFVGASAQLVEARELLAALAVSAPQQGEVTALLAGATSLLPDPLSPGSDPLHLLGPPLRPDERIAVNGAFKTPALRNVELTAPYFHNGGQATLEQVVAFYDRGGDFSQENERDLATDIRPLHLDDGEQAALVAFLKSLTDERVRFDRGVFDHPSLSVPNGGTADERLELGAVGVGGSAVGRGTPAAVGTLFGNFLDALGP